MDKSLKRPELTPELIEERVRVWLDRVGWERNPFARPGSLTAAVRRAEEERETLGRHFLWTVIRIGMPWTEGVEGYEKLLDDESHGVLFAAPGEGKSACRLMVADEARKHDILVVEYLRFDRHPRSVKEHEREIEFRILQVLGKQGKAFEAPEPLRHLADLSNTAKEQGFKATFVLFDDVIEGLGPGSTEDEIVQAITDLFHPHLLNIPGLYFKFFLPDSSAGRISDYSVIAGGGYPIDLFHMRWVEQTLRELLREKILSVSQRGEDSFFPLSDDGTGQPFDTDGLLVEKALSRPGAPRNLNVLICNLIYAHARNEPNPEKPRLTKRDLEDAILRFEFKTKPPKPLEEALLPARERDTAASILQDKIEIGDFDVFLAHNNADKPQVVAIADALKQRGLYPWLDIEQIPPGRWFQDVIQQAIPKVKSAAVIIGTKGLGRWQALELRSFISQCVEGGLPVIPVLLPGVTDLPPELLFLKELNWVHFSESIDEAEALDRLEWGITGEHPGRTLK